MRGSSLFCTTGGFVGCKELCQRFWLNITLPDPLELSFGSSYQQRSKEETKYKPATENPGQTVPLFQKRCFYKWKCIVLTPWPSENHTSGHWNKHVRGHFCGVQNGSHQLELLVFCKIHKMTRQHTHTHTVLPGQTPNHFLRPCACETEPLKWKPNYFIDPVFLVFSCILKQTLLLTFKRVCLPCAGYYTCVEVIFTLRRQVGFYMMGVYAPTLLIVVLSWLSFWINPDASAARVPLGKN